ncbi:MAG TPA: DNA repair protein RecN [Segeticoccus sp.]|uniref:DNA repair protein RecN n=1 Tax=Segeticoccus sp. TaxID=2706531 RepID=UPI002D7FE36E|nr:DNA repair protein RecN [Segeticoccus sp.]HET8601271.1 DNA repair protein RecN [Segeticoccus sp.]
MLRQIRIQGLGVIDDAVLDLAPGLNVVTGETGAGKTMVVSGLGLLLGARADGGRVRRGAKHAVVEGLVELPPDHPAAVRAAEAGADVEDDLILVRTVSDQGRSRAHLGGRSAPVGTLAEVGRLLVAVHGQADQWRLKQPDQHRVLLDRFAGASLQDRVTDLAQRYADLLALRAESRRLRAEARERARRVDLLRAGLEEIEAVDPLPGEDEDLRAESERLTHADGLRHGAGAAHAAVVGTDELDGGTDGAASVVDLVERARSALGPVAAHDPQLSALDGRLRELSYLASDLGAELATYAAGVEADPARLDQVQERRAELAGLQRKYGDTNEDVLAWAKQSAQDLLELETADERLDHLDGDIAALTAELAEQADAISAERSAAAERLAHRVTAELEHLALAGARIEVVVAQQEQPDGLPLPDGRTVRCGPSGIDDVEIRFAAGAGTPLLPVGRAASGGELSRLMLALEVVSASGDVPTFVFDEVDAGVGGAAALDVGARLATLAKTAQVIVVTHLAQVAAHAERHLVVRRAEDAAVTVSDVRAVEGEDRLHELARMLGGVADSAAALEHAQELLDQGRSAR